MLAGDGPYNVAESDEEQDTPVRRPSKRSVRSAMHVPVDVLRINFQSLRTSAKRPPDAGTTRCLLLVGSLEIGPDGPSVGTGAHPRPFSLSGTLGLTQIARETRSKARPDGGWRPARHSKKYLLEASLAAEVPNPSAVPPGWEPKVAPMCWSHHMSAPFAAVDSGWEAEVVTLDWREELVTRDQRYNVHATGTMRSSAPKGRYEILAEVLTAPTSRASFPVDSGMGPSAHVQLVRILGGCAKVDDQARRAAVLQQMLGSVVRSETLKGLPNNAELFTDLPSPLAPSHDLDDALTHDLDAFSPTSPQSSSPTLSQPQLTALTPATSNQEPSEAKHERVPTEAELELLKIISEVKARGISTTVVHNSWKVTLERKRHHRGRDSGKEYPCVKIIAPDGKLLRSTVGVKRKIGLLLDSPPPKPPPLPKPVQEGADRRPLARLVRRAESMAGSAAKAAIQEISTLVAVLQAAHGQPHFPRELAWRQPGVELSRVPHPAVAPMASSSRMFPPFLSTFLPE